MKNALFSLDVFGQAVTAFRVTTSAANACPHIMQTVKAKQTAINTKNNFFFIFCLLIIDLLSFCSHLLNSLISQFLPYFIPIKFGTTVAMEGIISTIKIQRISMIT